jgi:UPF0755 protein
MSDRRAEGAQPRTSTGGVRPRSPAEALEPTRAPQRPRGAKIRRERPRLNKAVKWMSGLLTLTLVGLVGTGVVAAYLYRQLDAAGPLGVTRAVAIPKGEGRIEIAARLEREGIINDRYAFIVGHIYHSWGNKKNFELKAGEYEIKKQASLRQVMDTLVEGRSVQFRLTIPEGLTSQQIVERLKADPNLTGEIASIPREGSLMPDTYRFARGMSRQEILDWMAAEQKKLLAEAWRTRQPGLPYQTMEQALVMASIVEKETGRDDERDRVAAVFVNRLRKNMRLQSDPTIIYGIVGGQGSLGRGILRSEIDTKTAYNTYQIDGLPPTPICNPGRSAIKATLNPAKTADLFFVADGSGGHVFTQNLKDHNAAVARWRQVEREMKNRQEAAQPAAAAGQSTRAVSRTAPAGDEQPAAEAPSEGNAAASAAAAAAAATAAAAGAAARNKGRAANVPATNAPAAKTTPASVAAPTAKK